MNNYKLALVGMLCLCHVLNTYGQGPSCQSLNLPVERDDSATIVVGDFVVNAATLGTINATLRNPFGGVIASEPNGDASTTFRINACKYLNQTLVLNVMANNLQCRSEITFKQSHIPLIAGRSTTVFCGDPLLAPGKHIDGSPPTALVPCLGERPATFVSDWTEVFECSPDHDTAMVIYRMYEAYGKDGSRGTTQDTINVIRLPVLDDINTICDAKDTVNCSSRSGLVGPSMSIIDDGVPRNIYFVRYSRNRAGDLEFSGASFDALCGISVSVESVSFGGQCPKNYKVEVEVKQDCQLDSEPWKCEFWVTDIDTIPPEVGCYLEGLERIGDTVIVSAGAHSCAALIYVPPVIAQDDCHDVSFIKADVEGFGSVSLVENRGLWMATTPVEIKSMTDPLKIRYEAIDECHNVAYDSCFVKVHDQMNPIAIADKVLNVSLSGKEVWVDAESFDEESWDNCGVMLSLVRREDWKEAGMNLCEGLKDGPTEDLFTIDLTQVDGVGGHYANNVQWLQIDQGPCNDLLWDAWRYDLMRYASLDCAGVLPNVFDTAIFNVFADDEYLVELSQLGGGWSNEVPFFCEDLCDSVTVELLVMDYWCNWNTSWSKAWIEDKTPLNVVNELEDSIALSCNTFNNSMYRVGGKSISLSEIVERASNGEETGIEVLDELFGSYVKGWIDPQNRLVDEEGSEIAPYFELDDQVCNCRDTTGLVERLEHDGSSTLVDSTWRICDYDDRTRRLDQGLVVVNCSDILTCTQQVWAQLDACGGTIYRKFTITSGCASAEMEPIERLQVITVGATCPLDPGMFSLPSHTSVKSCGLMYDPDGSGNLIGALHPDRIGRPEFTFSTDCRNVAIGYTDKALEVAGAGPEDPCYKVIRTWCLLDWCEIGEPQENWLSNPNYESKAIKYEQYIKVFCECVCLLDCSNLSDTTIACEDIPTNLSELYVFFDTPAIISPDPMIECEDTLDNKIVIDTNECGIGTITRTWYLIDPLGRLADSCDEIIYLAPSEARGREGKSYQGDTEPFNCSDFITTDPVIIDAMACPLLGEVVISNDSPYAEKDSNDASGEYPVGVHYVTYSITSNCFDDFEIVDTITVIDDVMPVVLAFSDPCVSMSEFMDDFGGDPLNQQIRQMIGLEGVDNCDIDTVFLIDLDTTYFPDSIVQDTILFTYQWQALDVNGNLSQLKEVTILVSDSCNISASIRGAIATENGQAVRGVTVRTMMEGNANDYLSNDEGQYSLMYDSDHTMEIIPEKDYDHKNGLSTADLIYIQDHILGRRFLKNKYREMAADVNADGKVNPIDLILLRKLILGQIDRFENAPSWRFVNKINGESTYRLAGSAVDRVVDFIGVKVGDVDQSSDPSTKASRSSDPMMLLVSDRILEASETIRIPVSVRDLAYLRGGQFTLKMDPVSLQFGKIVPNEEVGLTYDCINASNVNRGLVGISWSNSLAFENTLQDQILFSIEVIASKRVKISDVMTVSDDLLPAEGYGGNMVVKPVAMQYIAGPKSRPVLHVNSPNPFKYQTMIRFSLPSDMEATLRVMDINGRTLKTINGRYRQGMNLISLDSEDLNSGVLYYQLEAASFVATRKMILLE